MTRIEMLAMVKRLFIADGTESEINEMVHRLDAAVPHANISDMIYYPDQDHDEEQIVDEALRREQAHEGSMLKNG